MRSLRFVSLAVLVACGGGERPAPLPANHVAGVETDTCKLQPSWKPDEMAVAALGNAPVPRQTRVLAWQQSVDERPLNIDSALVWIETADHRYVLAHLYRHPADDNRWHKAMVYDAPTFHGSMAFDAPPTHADLDEFLGASDWAFDAEQGFRLLASQICAKAWRASFGEPPWHAYSATPLMPAIQH